MVFRQFAGMVAAVTLILGVAFQAMIPVSRAAAQDDRPQIVASFSILADVAQNVAGEAADVTTLIPLGGDPHSYAPSARDAATLSDADLVLTVGMNFEETLLPVIDEAAGDRTVSVSQCVPVRAVESGTGAASVEATEQAQAASSAEPQGDADPVAEACARNRAEVAAAFGVDEPALSDGTLGPLYALDCAGDAHDGEEHAVASCDPHVWTDPANAALWTLAIRDTLAELDPANAAAYAANAEAYLSALAAVDAEVQDRIAAIPAERRAIVTNHLAMNYFAHRYGLEIVGVVIPGGGTAAEPSVQEVLALVTTVQEYGVPALFTDMTANSDLAGQVADEAGTQVVPLYTGSLSEPDGAAGTYLDYLRYNANAFAVALS